MPLLYCNHCRRYQPVGLSERIGILRARGKLIRDKQPDPAIVEVLFQSELPRIACPHCQSHSLEQRADPDAGFDDEQWGEARRCAGCGQAIHPERLEVLPETRQCTACAAAGRTGEGEEREFCPRCGAEMKLSAVGGHGLARYAMRCSECGFRG